MKHILAIDLGTTGNRIIVFDKEAKVVLKKYREFTQIYPKPGWVEHDAMEIWECVMKLLDETLKEIPKEDIAGIGITNQRETVLCWDKNTGVPLHNAIVWQDCRTQDYCAELNKNPELKDYIIKNTGLKIDPYFSGTKVKWLIDNAVKEKEDVLFGTIDSWILWKLSGVHATDHTNASRTMLYNLNTNDWDEKLMHLFGVRRDMLPKIVKSSEKTGEYKGMPIAGIAGDQQAALFGQRCFEEGDAKNTYGTGCFCLMNTGKKIVHDSNGLLATVGIALDEGIYYALEGTVFIGGAVVQWLRDELKIISNASETEQISKSVEDTHGVYFVPAFAGLGTPHWNKEVRGTIFGLSRGANKSHIVRAAVESIAYQSRDLIEIMEKSSDRLNQLNADGGATKNSFLMQFQADILDKKVFVPDVEETTALGAAFLAGLAVGFWKGREEIKGIKISGKEFNPSMDESKRKEVLSSWERYVSQLIK